MLMFRTSDDGQDASFYTKSNRFDATVEPIIVPGLAMKWRCRCGFEAHAGVCKGLLGERIQPQFTKLPIEHCCIERVVDEAADCENQDQLASSLSVNLDCRGDCTDQLQNRYGERLSADVMTARQHADKQN